MNINFNLPPGCLAKDLDQVEPVCYICGLPTSTYLGDKPCCPECKQEEIDAREWEQQKLYKKVKPKKTCTKHTVA